MFHQAFDAAKRGCALPDAHIGGCGDGGLFTAFDTDRKHGPETAFHLARGNGMAREIGQAGIEHVFDGGMAMKMFGDGARIGGRRAHAHE